MGPVHAMRLLGESGLGDSNCIGANAQYREEIREVLARRPWESSPANESRTHRPKKNERNKNGKILLAEKHLTKPICSGFNEFGTIS